MKTEIYRQDDAVTKSPQMTDAQLHWTIPSLSPEQEQAMDVAEANRRLADPNEKRIPFDDLKAELGM